jgi:SAM-dependent methyltransferase
MMASRISFAERVLLFLFHWFPPRETIFKDPAPRAAAEYEDERHFGFHEFFGSGPELFAGRDVLDLGSGYGGRPIAYLERGAKSVTGVEIEDELVEHSRAFAKDRGADDAYYHIGTGEDIPCRDEKFDLVVMNDVMEHVVSPAATLSETWRVLRPGGYLAVVFPPYYDVSAGSHLHGYATRVPGLNLLFPTRTLKAAATRLFAGEGVDYRRYLRDLPSDKLWNQNGLTVRRFKQLVRGSGFEVAVWRQLGHLDHRISRRRGVKALATRPVYLAAELPAQIPILEEVLCLRICAVLQKRRGLTGAAAEVQPHWS